MRGASPVFPAREEELANPDVEVRMGCISGLSRRQPESRTRRFSRSPSSLIRSIISTTLFS